jgi:hypothetical protein
MHWGIVDLFGGYPAHTTIFLMSCGRRQLFGLEFRGRAPFVSNFGALISHVASYNYLSLQGSSLSKVFSSKIFLSFFKKIFVSRHLFV